MSENNKETRALAIRAPTGITPQSVDEATSMAKLLSQSILVPEQYRNKPADVFMAITYGCELGMPPVTALLALNVIKGKPGLWANSMVALVISRRDVCKYFKRISSDTKHAIYETWRVGHDKPIRYEFTFKDAEAAQLTGEKGNYRKYPRQMLEARAKGYLAKDVYPDVLSGLSSVEELQEIPELATPTQSSDFMDPTPQQIPEKVIDADEAVGIQVTEADDKTEADDDAPSLIDLILGTKSIEELEGMLPQFKGLAGDAREQTIKVYRQQTETLEKAEAQQ